MVSNKKPKKSVKKVILQKKLKPKNMVRTKVKNAAPKIKAKTRKVILKTKAKATHAKLKKALPKPKKIQVKTKKVTKPKSVPNKSLSLIHISEPTRPY